ncbi:hypothetical protein [Pseudarthrobacter sulfonivorans]|uniref:hypothetical protein n=1 Tax=Pseudarthrobacter sulfonivorans TaxID=121292 RepID=UPI00278ACF66|nr:hypothetical protein [Pseudarthrobacter sulfonivorans]MDP9998285.1 hypothetical protein [Pseudarthrobacter sulfonivorans]
MITVVSESSFASLVNEAKKACVATPVLNMILCLKQYPLPAGKDAFIRNYIDVATHWQSVDPPPEYLFSHGQYMHKYGQSIDYLVSQLIHKPTGNRACISLVDTGDIMQSNDGKLPSFLVLQAATEHGGSHLTLTSYYRALEVNEFLPINLAEMALIADQVRQSMPTLVSLDLVMHAFRAHSQPGFRAHVRSRLDIAASDEVASVVKAKDRAKIATWLMDKARPETVIDTAGLATLTTELAAAGWAKDEVEQLNKAVGLETQLSVARSVATHAAGVSDLQSDLSDLLRRIASTLRDAKDD